MHDCLVISPTAQAKHVGSSVHYPSSSYRICIGGSDVAKGGAGRAQAFPNACCALPPRLQKDWNTLIEQSNILLNQLVGQVWLPTYPVWLRH